MTLELARGRNNKDSRVFMSRNYRSDSNIFSPGPPTHKAKRTYRCTEIWENRPEAFRVGRPREKYVHR